VSTAVRRLNTAYVIMDIPLRQMKRFFPTSLALLLVMGSLGQVFAAAFCPRMVGHDCCLATASRDSHSAQSNQHMHGMAMDAMANDSMPMDGNDMQDMVMDDANIPPSSSIDPATQLSTSEEFVPTNKLELPIEACTHCMSHSGVPNAPISSVSVADKSNKDFASVLLPVSRFLVRPSMTLAQIGLPREHAPPGTNAPRYILISVFLI
jgi:hypothetical protein